jgi:tetratricopeptide (TPR) repeat protein
MEIFWAHARRRGFSARGFVPGNTENNGPRLRFDVPGPACAAIPGRKFNIHGPACAAIPGRKFNIHEDAFMAEKNMQEDLGKVIEELEKKRAEKPDSITVHHQLGLVYRKAGRFEEALAALEKGRKPRQPGRPLL